ncbi:hypothetical protein [Gorillibacterium sp. sgz500922]|uniref:hypothetical protein n=1 Tax=Gorillibacterium sp. sgz500922 TaxID=3446694 RepID=UPI003F67A0B1
MALSLVMVACEEQRSSLAESVSPAAQTATSSAFAPNPEERQVAELTKENADLKTQLAELEQARSDLLLLQDKSAQLFDSSGLLFDTVKAFKSSLPITKPRDDREKQILEAVDYANPMLALKGDELILSAGTAPIEANQSEAVVELTVYRKTPTLGDVGPIQVMFLHMQKVNGKWAMVSFSRSN